MPDKKRTPTGALGGLLGLVGLSAVAGILITATVTPAIAVSGAAASSAIKIFDNMPSILKIDELMQPTTFWAGDQVLTQFYDQNRSPVSFEEVAPVMYDAILSSEDPRYYQHGGVDLIGTTRALLSNAQGGATQGGSSISQQYVKNVLIQRCEKDAVATDTQTRDEVLLSCWNEATNAKGVDGYERKLQEMRYAIQLEKEYSKNDILLGYLNIANFGGTTYGIDAAAKYYFNVPASQLSLAQAATLAGVVQNPNTYRIDKSGGSIIDSNGVGYNKAPDGLIDDVNPDTIAALGTMLSEGKITQEQYVAAADGYSATKGRQLYVLSRLLDDGKITQEQYDAAAIEPITPTIMPAETGCASTGAAAYFCQYVLYTVRNDPAFGDTPEARERALKQDGLNIYTTLDWRVQTPAQDTMAANTPASVQNMNFGSTVVSVETGTGRVLAIAQNTKFSEDANVLATEAGTSSLVYAGDSTYGRSTGFQAGSTFKLFTLIDWLEKGHSVNEVLNGNQRVFKKIPNSCDGDWINYANEPIYNFGRVGGRTGTPMQFTAASLNTGYLAMAEQLDLCDIGNVAKKMGVIRGDGKPLNMTVATSVIGINNVSPLAMASAYATVANNGIYCQPQVIDRVTNAKGEELADKKPVKTCEQVMTPEVAATAAYALQGVMTGGGTGVQGNPRDGTPLIGKTGTHEEIQTWMIESSSKVVTAAWVGNTLGENSVFNKRFKGVQLSNIRYTLARDVQRAADAAFGGDAFPQPDTNLSRQVLRDVPNVVGQPVDQAQTTLEEAGFTVQVGDPVDSDQPAGMVGTQNPSGRAAAGATIILSPSNGQGIAIPPVAGGSVADATTALGRAGFVNLSGSCSVNGGSPDAGLVQGTNPAAGTIANPNTPVSISYTAKAC